LTGIRQFLALEVWARPFGRSWLKEKKRTNCFLEDWPCGLKPARQAGAAVFFASAQTLWRRSKAKPRVHSGLM
jgi:hypothetical protein